MCNRYGSFECFLAKTKANCLFGVKIADTICAAIYQHYKCSQTIYFLFFIFGTQWNNFFQSQKKGNKINTTQRVTCSQTFKCTLWIHNDPMSDQNNHIVQIGVPTTTVSYCLNFSRVISTGPSWFAWVKTCSSQPVSW